LKGRTFRACPELAEGCAISALYSCHHESGFSPARDMLFRLFPRSNAANSVSIAEGTKSGPWWRTAIVEGSPILMKGPSHLGHSAYLLCGRLSARLRQLLHMLVDASDLVLP
jgi:hypothetical protein